MNPSLTPFIAGNWKMNLTMSEATALAAACAGLAWEHDGVVDVGIFPSTPFLTSVQTAVGRAPLRIGAQNCSHEPWGAFTGDVSAGQISSMGITFMLVGHSERRHVYGETNEWVARKLRLALDTGLAVVFCVGETEAEWRAGSAESAVSRQLAPLADLSEEERGFVDVAYEPVWAVGTGFSATPSQAQTMHAYIRQCLDSFGDSSNTRILYGGSVTPANAHDLLACRNVEGLLVGGTSLKIEAFGEIVRAAHR